MWDNFSICTLMNKQAICIVKNYNNNILKETVIKYYNSTTLNKEAAWIVATILRNNYTFIKNIIEIVESSSTSTLSKEVASTLDK